MTLELANKRVLVTRATHVDHVKPHKGDWNLFCLGELQSLCASCHNSRKRYIELQAEPWLAVVLRRRKSGSALDCFFSAESAHAAPYP